MVGAACVGVCALVLACSDAMAPGSAERTDDVDEGPADAAGPHSPPPSSSPTPDGGSATPARLDVDGGQHEAPVELTYHRDVKPILDARCAGCHFDGGIGPMALSRFEEVEPWLDLIEHTVVRDLMPPWSADMPTGFFLGDRRLTEHQKQTLLSWIAQGAEAGDPADASDAVTPASRGLERVDLRLPMAESYAPNVHPDDYRCFVMEWPLDGPRFITGLSIEPGDRSIVHHALLYLVDRRDAQLEREQDAAADGLGYGCLTGPGPRAARLYSFEPGGSGHAVPGGLGFEVEPGDVLVLQMHYNTLGGSGPDRSTVELTLEDAVEARAINASFARRSWINGWMPIAAGDPDAVHSYRGRPPSLDDSTRYAIHWVGLHMHALGSRGHIGIARDNAPDGIELLLDIPRWDFEWQETYLLAEPVILEPGDQLYMECHWDNTADNQPIVAGERLPPRDVNWGAGTTDEMCLGDILAQAID